MKIEKYQPNQKEALIGLWKSVFPDDPPHNEPSIVLDAKLAVDDLIFVALDNDSVVGACMAGYDGHRGWLYAVAVLDEYRRQGTGAALVNHSLDALSEIGCSKVNLQIRAGNEAVASFYRSLGFDEEPRISMGKHLA
ncbi:MAG: GNAT family acetyltransferase [Pseudomonadota bacterium]